MQIKKYEKSSSDLGKITRSNSESVLATYSGEEKEYTLSEFLSMVADKSWKGGYVQFLGYVRQDVFEKSSEDSEYGSDMITFVHGSAITGENLEEKLASTFSFIKPPYNNQDPNIGMRAIQEVPQAEIQAIRKMTLVKNICLIAVRM